MLLRPSCSDLRPPARATALALCLGLAAAGAAGAVEAPFRLSSPQAGETWTAGTWATVEWEPAGSPADRAGLLEWEAFLSVDDGETYAVRLTPHLDIDLRRFTFEVPRLPTAEARLMLRFGDEREEHGFEIPGRFAIAPGSPQVPPFGEMTTITLHLGERARASDPGAVLWIEGSRRGGGLRTEVALPIRTSFSGANLDAWPFLYFLVGGPSSGRLSLPPLGVRMAELPPSRRGAALPAAGLSSAVLPPIRLLIHRFNE